MPYLRASRTKHDPTATPIFILDYFEITLTSTYYCGIIYLTVSILKFTECTNKYCTGDIMSVYVCIYHIYLCHVIFSKE